MCVHVCGCLNNGEEKGGQRFRKGDCFKKTGVITKKKIGRHDQIVLLQQEEINPSQVNLKSCQVNLNVSFSNFTS